MYWLAAVVVLTIVLSFICSIWEAALYSVPPSRVENLRLAGSSNGIRLSMLRERMDRPVSAILTLNTISNTAGATITGSLALLYLGKEHLTIFSVAFVLCILVFSEIIPKTLGYAHATLLAPIFAWPIQILVWIFYPAVVLSEWTAKALRPRKARPFPTEDDILSVARLGLKKGEILPEEHRWVKNALHLNNIEAGNIMTPRSEILYMDTDRELTDVLDNPERWAHSRIPLVRKGNLDDIAGIVLRHEVIGAVCEPSDHVKLGDLARPTHVVLPSVRGHTLLKEMIKRRQHLFIVADDAGKTLGLVTLEDVIEEMLGEEIYDEAESSPRPLAFRKRDRKERR